MSAVTVKAQQARREFILRVAGGVLAIGCFVTAISLWVSGAREAFKDCDADACAAFGTGLAKAAAFDYAKNSPEAIFLGLLFFVSFAACILGQIVQTASCAVFKCFHLCFNLCSTSGNTLTVVAVSTTLTATLVGLYYGAQDDITLECCPNRPDSAPAATQASFVLAALPAIVVVGVFARSQCKKEDPPPELDTMMAMRLLQIS